MGSPVRSLKVAVLLAVVAFIVTVAALPPGRGTGNVDAQPTVSAPSVITGSTVLSDPPVVETQQSLSASAPTQAQLSAAQAHMAFRDAAWAARTETPSSEPRGAAPVVPTARPTLPSGPARGPAAPETLTVYRNNLARMAGSVSNIAEPSVAAAGKHVFMTWNWGASISHNGGTTWTAVDPYAGFVAPHSFCCDQDTLYDRGRDMMIWYRQGVLANSVGQNQVKISRSNDGGVTWLTYNLQPITLNPTWTNQWFDYPHLAVSNDYLYITTNMFSSGGAFIRMIVMRWRLDDLRAGVAAGVTTWSRTAGWSWAPVQGAREVMYLGDTTSSGGIFTVFTQKESDTLLTSVNVTIPAWTFTAKNTGSCPVLGGLNPCARADQRITDGVVTNNTAGGSLTSGVITFFWNVKQGGTFPKPYVNAASFNEVTKALVSQPVIWNTAITWHWASVSSNERGDIGATAYIFDPLTRPRVAALIDDDMNGNPPGWENVQITNSAGNPSASSWGDYSRVRPNYPCGTGWSASVYSKDVATTSEPRFVQFGRGRDLPCNQRWGDK